MDSMLNAATNPESSGLIYVGPEALRKIVVETYHLINPGFSQEPPTIEVSLDFMDYEGNKGTIYETLGYSTKEEYLTDVNSQLEELFGLREQRDELKEKRVNKYVPNDDEKAAEDEIDKKIDEKRKKLYDVFDSAIITKKLTGNLPNPDISSIGAYMSVTNTIYLEPMQVLHAKKGVWNKLFEDNFLHILTFAELRNTELEKDICELFEKYQQSETGREDIETKLITLSNLKSHTGIHAILEGVAFATAKNDPPLMHKLAKETGPSAEDYETAYQIFRKKIKETSYAEAVQLARDAINKAYEKETDAVQILCEMTGNQRVLAS